MFAEPENTDAREALAGAYDQLGYRAESGPWRDVYLTGALELRHGIQGGGPDLAAAADLLRHLPADRFFDSIATRVEPRKADGKQTTRQLRLHRPRRDPRARRSRTRCSTTGGATPIPTPTPPCKLTRDFLVQLATGQAGLREMIFSDDLAVEGSRLELLSFFSLLDRSADGKFPIVTP